jgi:hypothetical protein
LGQEHFTTSKLRMQSPLLEGEKDLVQQRFELLRSEMEVHAHEHVVLGAAAINRLRETGWNITR